MIRGGHTPPDALRLPDRPKLRKGLGTLDRRRVVPHRRVNVIRAAIRGHCTFVGAAAAGVVVAVGLDDVVLDERVLGPAVDGEVAVSAGVEAAAVVDCPGEG